MDADSFYDTLLASIGPLRHGHNRQSRQKSPDTPPQEKTPSPTPLGIAEPTLPKPILNTNVFTESPKEISSIEAPSSEPNHEAESEDAAVDSSATLCASSTSAPSSTQAAQSPTSKASTTLEAELRAKLLASKKKLKASGSSQTLPKRPSPVDIGVPQPSTQSSRVAASCSPPPQLHGKLALPPKPPQRDGFRLRIRLPFPFAASSFITVETEKLALTTPISSILDLFNRRSPQDHLYFASPSPLPTDPPVVDTPEVEAGDSDLGAVIDPGQRFYRDPPRNTGGGGWRDAAPSRGGPHWDPTVGNLRATLEDVATTYGAEVVDCEIRSDQPMAAAGTDGTASGCFEEEGAEDWQEGEVRRGDEEWVSPIEQAGWEYHDQSAYLLHPQQQWNLQWQQQQNAFPIVPMNWIPDAAAYQQPMAPLPEPRPGAAQRWIPGHQDYNDAGWRFGFRQKGEEEHTASSSSARRPSRPAPTQIDLLKVHSSRRENIAEVGPAATRGDPSLPAGKLSSTASTLSISQGPSGGASIPSLVPPQGPRALHAHPEGKKHKKKRGGGGTDGVRTGAVKKKKGKEVSGRGGRGRGGG